MTRRLLPWLACLLLIGAGCVKAGNPPDWPTDKELASMLPGDKQVKMMEFLKNHPSPSLTKDEAQAETDQAHDLVLHHEIEQMAEFHESAYEAQGSTRIVKNGDQEYLVMSDDFFVDDGPYLVVYLNDSLDPLTLGPNAIEIGRLKKNDGGQAYTIPKGTDTSIYRSVLVYSKPFHEVFGYATFK